MRRSIVPITLLATIVLAGCSGSEGGGSTTMGPGGATTTESEPVTTIEDGEFFALVTVGEDESGDVTLGVDVAEILSGEEARAAAVEDGFIAEGEELPNDFYIRNPEAVSELLHFGESPEILVISSTETSQMVSITAQDLKRLYEGTHPNGDTFYLAADSPIPMDVTVSDGEIIALSQVYLP